MNGNERIRQTDLRELRLVKYPDPRLTETCVPVDHVDDSVRALAERMFEIMYASRGVGLAASQAGVTVRMFVASPTFEEDDRRVLINPEIIATEGLQEEEEGCLSLPGIAIRMRRSLQVTVRATDLSGNVVEETVDDLAARVYQHEMDHLDGVLLTDRMGSVARLTSRRVLKNLEAEFAGG